MRMAQRSTRQLKVVSLLNLSLALILFQCEKQGIQRIPVSVYSKFA